MGKIVFTDNKLKQERSIDFSSFNSGLYLIKIYISENVYTEKIIIM